MDIIKSDFPCYLIDSDKISLNSQRIYKWANYLILIVLFAATIVCSNAYLRDKWPMLNKLTGLFLLLTTAGSIILLILKPERGWYNGRAVAESIKTSTWKYMMGESPFGTDNNKNNRGFIEKIEAIIHEATTNGFKLTKTYSKHRDIITNQMAVVRSLNFIERKSVYSLNRIEEQIEWYSRKSKSNSKKVFLLGAIIVILQLFAGIYLLFFLDSLKEVGPIEIIVFITTAVLNIIELNRYKELSQSYALTAVELNIIRSKFGSVQNDIDLNKFVEDSESAISREHTMWLARKK